MLRKNRAWPVIVFLTMELMLYGLILTSQGSLLIFSEYSAIVLCLFFTLLYISRENLLFAAGLAFTVAADYCLVVCDPIQQLWGMVFFLLAQSCYAVILHRQGLHKAFLAVRLGLILLVEGVAVAVLREKTDALALVSMCYYVNLIVNMLCAFARFRQNRLLAIGFVLFLLCDTVIGLQTAAGSYLPIGKDSLLHRILFMDFHLSWFFYLPSQVLIALHSSRYRRNRR